jgi:hypothetical protein
MSEPKKDPRAKLFLRMFHRARMARAPFDKQWNSRLSWLLGKQYLPKEWDWQANTITNLAFSMIYTIIPWVGGRRPEVQIDSRNAIFDDLATEITPLHTRILKDNEIEDLSIQMVYGMSVNGTGWWKNTWNSRLNGGLGGVEMKTVPTEGMFLQPGKQHARDCDYIFELRKYDKMSLLRKYPNKQAEINAVFRKAGIENRAERDGLETQDAGIGYHAYFDDPPGVPTPDTSTQAYFYDVATRAGKDKSSVEVVEIHFFDNSTMELRVEVEEKADRAGKTIPKEPGRKTASLYPNGHVVAVCGDYILEERGEPFPGHPYIQAQNYYIEGRPYSISDLEIIIPLQKQLNEANNRIFDGIAKSIGRTIFSGPTSGLEDNTMDNGPDEIVRVENVGDIQPLDSPRLPSTAFNWPALIQSMMEEVLGLSEALKGEKPGDVRSGFAIEQLQQASANRMLLKTRSLELAIKDASKYHTHMISANYRPGIEFDGGIFSGLPGHNGQEMTIKDIKPHLFEYIVRAGVNLRASRSADVQFYQWMLEKELIDNEYFIKHADIPGKAPLLRRMKPKWDAQAALLEDQANQVQGGAG